MCASLFLCFLGVFFFFYEKGRLPNPVYVLTGGFLLLFRKKWFPNPSLFNDHKVFQKQGENTSFKPQQRT